jgi:hypothetical protein
MHMCVLGAVAMGCTYASSGSENVKWGSRIIHHITYLLECFKCLPLCFVDKAQCNTNFKANEL